MNAVLNLLASAAPAPRGPLAGRRGITIGDVNITVQPAIDSAATVVQQSPGFAAPPAVYQQPPASPTEPGAGSSTSASTGWSGRRRMRNCSRTSLQRSRSDGSLSADLSLLASLYHPRACLYERWRRLLAPGTGIGIGK